MDQPYNPDNPIRPDGTPRQETPLAQEPAHMPDGSEDEPVFAPLPPPQMPPQRETHSEPNYALPPIPPMPPMPSTPPAMPGNQQPTSEAEGQAARNVALGQGRGDGIFTPRQEPSQAQPQAPPQPSFAPTPPNPAASSAPPPPYSTGSTGASTSPSQGYVYQTGPTEYNGQPYPQASVPPQQQQYQPQPYSPQQAQYGMQNYYAARKRLPAWVWAAIGAIGLFVVVLVALLLLVRPGGSGSASIVGKWKPDTSQPTATSTGNPGLDYLDRIMNKVKCGYADSIEFLQAGTASATSMFGAGAGHYAIIEGNRIKLTSPAGESLWTFSVSGDSLTLQGPEGCVPTRYVRAK